MEDTVASSGSDDVYVMKRQSQGASVDYKSHCLFCNKLWKMTKVTPVLLNGKQFTINVYLSRMILSFVKYKGLTKKQLT